MHRILCHRRLVSCADAVNSLTKVTASLRGNYTMPKPGFYAVKVGRVPGVYTSWQECEKQVKGYPNAQFKKFQTENEANRFQNEGSSNAKATEYCQSVTLSNQSNLEEIVDDVEFWSEFDFDEELLPVVTSSSASIPSASSLIIPKTSKDSYYAVHRGKKPGVYRTWTECSKQIEDFNNASYRKFETETDALEYVRTGGIQKARRDEINNIEFNNKVIKRRKINGTNDDEYILENSNEALVVFTDGASSKNGKITSRAGIGVYWGPDHPLNTSKRITGRQTNNRAEIYAAVHALHQAKQIGAKKIKLYTDSQFVIHSITDWIKKWKINGWKLVTGKEVANKEDFIALDLAREGIDVEWIYVKAHARNKGNEEADELARQGSNLLMTPENCSEFEKLHLQQSSTPSKSEPFLVSSVPMVDLITIPESSKNIPYYAVHRGNKPGVYTTWTDCEKQIRNFVNPSFRKFDSEDLAKEFVKSGKVGLQAIKPPECRIGEFVSVYTDGASSGNGTDSSKAGFGVYWGPGNALNTSMRLPGRQTNNRAEIWAAVHALRQAKQLGIKNIRLFTDSQFLINGITVWISQWKKKDWKLASGKPVINKEDFIALEQASKGLNVDWQYVKGHANIPGNVEADKLAVAGCDKPLSSTIILG